jgi:hypothetical protein
MDAVFEATDGSDVDPLDALGKLALNILLQLTSSRRVPVFEWCSCAASTRTTAAVGQPSQSVTLSRSVQPVRWAMQRPVPRNATVRDGKPSVLCVHRRTDAGLGAGSQRL